MTYSHQYAAKLQSIEDAELSIRILENEKYLILCNFCITYQNADSIIQSAKATGDPVFLDAIVMHLLSECKNEEEKAAIIKIDTP